MDPGLSLCCVGGGWVSRLLYVVGFGASVLGVWNPGWLWRLHQVRLGVSVRGHCVGAARGSRAVAVTPDGVEGDAVFPAA